jgi:hypothetical protein
VGSIALAMTTMIDLTKIESKMMTAHNNNNNNNNNPAHDI